MKLEEDSSQAKEAEARAVDMRRQQVHKAALDNMAGQIVSVLFASMATKDGGIGGGTDGRGTQGTLVHGVRGGKRASGNQDGEEEHGPRREGQGTSNQQTEGKVEAPDEQQAEGMLSQSVARNGARSPPAAAPQ